MTSVLKPARAFILTGPIVAALGVVALIAGPIFERAREPSVKELLRADGHATLTSSDDQSVDYVVLEPEIRVKAPEGHVGLLLGHRLNGFLAIEKNRTFPDGLKIKNAWAIISGQKYPLGMIETRHREAGDPWTSLQGMGVFMNAKLSRSNALKAADKGAVLVIQGQSPEGRFLLRTPQLPILLIQ